MTVVALADAAGMVCRTCRCAFESRSPIRRRSHSRLLRARGRDRRSRRCHAPALSHSRRFGNHRLSCRVHRVRSAHSVFWVNRGSSARPCTGLRAGRPTNRGRSRWLDCSRSHRRRRAVCLLRDRGAVYAAGSSATLSTGYTTFNTPRDAALNSFGNRPSLIRRRRSFLWCHRR